MALLRNLYFTYGRCNALLIASFIGSPTTSHVFGKTKSSLLKILQSSGIASSAAAEFDQLPTEASNIGQAAIVLFKSLYNESDPNASKSLGDLRYEAYIRKIRTSKSATVDLNNLPPTNSAAYVHGLRVYRQVSKPITLAD